MQRIVVVLATVAAVLAIVPPGPAAAGPDPVTVGVVDTATGRWHLWDPLDLPGGAATSFYYGNPGDVPFVGDWDCDGEDTPGLYRQSDGFVYLRNSNTQGTADIRYFFGDPGDVPLAGDFDGDGCDTVSLYRPSAGRVYVVNSLGSGERGLGAAETSFPFGDAGDVPFAGDFDGDLVDGIGLHRPGDRTVFLRNDPSGGPADTAFTYGEGGDLPLAGDWTQSGRDTVAVFRPADSAFYLRYANSPGPADEVIPTGHEGSLVPIAGRLGRARVEPFHTSPCPTSGYAGPGGHIATRFTPPEPSDAVGVLGLSFTGGRDCDRLVVGLGALAPGGAAFFEEAVPANHVPAAVEVLSFGNRIRVVLTGVRMGRGVSGMDFLAGPVGVVARETPPHADLYVDAWYPEPRELSVRFLSHPARVVVDSRPVATAPGPHGPVVGDGVVLREPIAFPPLDLIEVIGHARPFEASGTAFVTDLSTGRPADVIWVDCEPFPGGCAYTTSDYAEAWGEFRFGIAGLASGRYELFVVGIADMEGGGHDRGVRHQFTVP